MKIYQSVKRSTNNRFHICKWILCHSVNPLDPCGDVGRPCVHCYTYGVSLEYPSVRTLFLSKVKEAKRSAVYTRLPVRVKNWAPSTHHKSQTSHEGNECENALSASFPAFLFFSSYLFPNSILKSSLPRLFAVRFLILLERRCARKTVPPRYRFPGRTTVGPWQIWPVFKTICWLRRRHRDSENFVEEPGPPPTGSGRNFSSTTHGRGSIKTWPCFYPQPFF